MSHPLQDSQRDAGLLLMYLSGELSSRDRALLQQRLEQEPRLQEELKQMQADHAAYVQTMRRLEAQSAPVAQAAAAQAARRLVRRWSDERILRPKRPKPKELPLPWWCYLGASSAAVMVALILWSINRTGILMNKNLPPSLTTVHLVKMIQAVYPPTPSQAIDSLDSDQQQTLLETSFASSDSAQFAQALDQADQTIAEAQNSGDLDDVVFSQGQAVNSGNSQ
jgi:hypothetical protein